MSDDTTISHDRLRPDAFLMPAILFGAFVVIYFPVLAGLVRAWSASDDYSHGFVIVPLAIYILWGKREELSRTALAPSWLGLIVVLAGLFLYLFSRAAEVVTLVSLSMIPVLAGAVIFLFGWGIFRLCLFPLFLLVFMIPVPAQIYAALTIPLQLFVSKVSVALASMSGIPILREGNVLHLPHHTLEVVQACSGLRSIMTMLTLGAVFGYFTLRSNPLRGLLLLTAVPIAIFINIIRVMVMVAAFHYADFDLTQGTVHTLFGLFIFLVGIAMFFLLKGVLSTWDRSAASES